VVEPPVSWQSRVGKPKPELYRDPLHPNTKAYQIWAEKLEPLLRN
jgi:lysophospholipase L1-like esterase